MDLTIFFIGFSLVSAVLIAVTHFSCAEYKGKFISRLAGITLLLGLAGLQFSHYTFLQGEPELVHSVIYTLLLFTVAPAFYFFSRDLLKVENKLMPHWHCTLYPCC